MSLRRFVSEEVIESGRIALLAAVTPRPKHGGCLYIAGWVIDCPFIAGSVTDFHPITGNVTEFLFEGVIAGDDYGNNRLTDRLKWRRTIANHWINIERVDSSRYARHPSLHGVCWPCVRADNFDLMTNFR